MYLFPNGLNKNVKLHQIILICFLTLFQMIYFLYPERFPFLIFRLKKEIEVELNTTLFGFDLLPIEPSLLPFFDMLLTRNLELG